MVVGSGGRGGGGGRRDVSKWLKGKSVVSVFVALQSKGMFMSGRADIVSLMSTDGIKHTFSVRVGQINGSD